MKIQKQRVVKRQKKIPVILPVFILFFMSVLFFAGFLFGKPVYDALEQHASGDFPSGKSDQTGQALQVRSPYESEEWFQDPLGILLVVDRTTALSSDYEPVDLVDLSAHGIKTSSPGLQGRIVVVYDLLNMFEDAKKAGLILYIFSSYRSFKTQEKTYNFWIKKIGKEEADRSSARPGHSEHQLGTTFDMSSTDYKGDVFDGFGASPAGNWLAQNAYKYGFVMSYPVDSESITGYIYEPWHFRYVGRECAKVIREKGVIPSIFIRELDTSRNGSGGQGTSTKPQTTDPKLQVLGKLDRKHSVGIN